MSNNSNQVFNNTFKKAYINLYNLHPATAENDFRFRYLKVDWFFPNHINNVLEQVKIIGNKYFDGVDLQVSLYGGLFHDAGLVYKREFADPSGHEKRSIKYAQEELRALGYDLDFIKKVIECIKATEPSYISISPEALLVRNADAYAHIISMHFFAKANFAQDIHSFVDWFERKIKSTYSKLTISSLKQEIVPLVDYYGQMIKNYRLHKESKDFLSTIIKDL